MSYKSKTNAKEDLIEVVKENVEYCFKDPNDKIYIKLPVVKIGSKSFYKESDLIAFIESNTVNS